MWYPKAVRLELQPESRTQAAIRPTQLIVHSVVAPWDEHRIYAYWRDSTTLESHFGLDFDGSLGQYLSTTTRADASYQANRRPDGTGAISIETASNTSASDPWTDDQLQEVCDLGVWVHREHDIPLRICRTHSDPGFGYHRLHAPWSPSGTLCPGQKRVRQFHEELFPAIVAAASKPPCKPTAAKMATVHLAHIIAAAKRDPGLPQGGTTHKAEALTVERALYAEGLLAKRWVDGSMGTKSLAAYAAWQRSEAGGGYTDAAADGIPGRDSLTRLSKRHAFKVV